MKMITAESLSFLYRKPRRAILHDFSLSLEKGRVCGLLGKNGAGKSTLLYLMSDLLTLKNGRVLYHGTGVRYRLPIALQDIFLVPEEFDLPPVSLISYVELNNLFHPRFSKEDMVKYLHYFEMDINIDLGAFSMRQKKKMLMNFALAANTSLLLTGELIDGLDISGKSQFRKFVASSMTDDETILTSTHQVRDVDKVLDHVLIMDNSRVLLSESVMGICDKLLSTESDGRTLLQSSLYSAPSIQGSFLLLPNESGEGSEINPELFLDATLAAPERISALFHTKQPELR